MDKLWTLVARATKLCRVAPDSFSTTTAACPLRTEMCIGSEGTPEVWVLTNEVVSFHPSGALDLEGASRFLENWRAPVLAGNNSEKCVQIFMKSNIAYLHSQQLKRQNFD
jgi:hypothetical protein